nr:hypothetical protein BaRGS_023127 [Batillaria attramentaria]
MNYQFTVWCERCRDVLIMAGMAGVLDASMEALLHNDTANVTLSAINDTNVLEVTTKKFSVVYLSDDDSLNSLPEFVAANYIDYIYAPICSALGIIGNLLAFCVLVSARAKSTTYVYMSSLSISDTLVQIVNILFLVRKFPGHETLKEGTCGFVFFLLYFSIHYNVVVMVTMTIERYIAIRFPLQAGRWFTLRRARILVAVEALLVFGLDMQHLILRGMVFDEEQGESFCMPKGETTMFYLFKIWPWIDGVIYCYAPLSCLVIFNILILKQVRSSRSFQSKTAGPEAGGSSSDKTSSSKMSEKELQLTRMLLLVTTAFLVCVGPMAVVIVVERYYWIPVTNLEKAQYHLVRTILNNLDYTNHALNFLLYCFSGQRFREELRQTFSCICPASGSGSVAGPGVASGNNMSRDVSKTTNLSVSDVTVSS